MPPRFGKWNSGWRRFQLGNRVRVWQRLAKVQGKPDLEELQLDSASVEARQSLTGSRKEVAEAKRSPITGVVSAARDGVQLLRDSWCDPARWQPERTMNPKKVDE